MTTPPRALPELMIDWTRQCAAVIPCFNEAGRIGAVVHAVRRFVPAVIVVDDGSADATAAEARQAGAIVIRHSANRGKGCALRSGWQESRRLGFSWVLSLDGDGQHAAADIPGFFQCAEQTGARLVIGNRMDRVAEMPLVRRWANRWMSRCLANLTGATVPDSQCGFRLAHLDTLLRLPLTSHRFVIESETLVAFLRAGGRVEFVPIEVIYGRGRSRISPWRDTWRWMRWRLNYG
jgi:glycosyltransferase involved in cell wall biosynthesis